MMNPTEHITQEPPYPIDPHLQESDYFKQILKTENKATTYVTVAILSFILTKSLLNYTAPSVVKCQGSVTIWKWVNTANSMIHSSVTGIGAVLCMWKYPKIPENVISTYSDFSHRLVSYSVGYFIFDFFDMLANHRKRSSYELMLHHIFVLSCFTLSITTRYYLSFTIISLTIEINSIFLHLRQLLLISKTPKSTLTYKLTSSLNILTFLTFRILVLSWMTHWMTIHKHLVNPAPFALGLLSVSVLMVMSIVLLVRLVKADFMVVTTNDGCMEGLHGEDNNNAGVTSYYKSDNNGVKAQ